MSDLNEELTQRYTSAYADYQRAAKAVAAIQRELRAAGASPKQVWNLEEQAIATHTAGVKQ